MSNGIVIAGTHSGCGKTTVTLGILSALKKRGLKVQSFKAGPDFIDAGLHRLITGRPSRNLDLWMCGENYVRDCFIKHSAETDISVVEGVMGLYDGDFSTARLANALNLPIILIVDAYGMAESAGAVVKGFVEYKTQSSRAAEQQSSRTAEKNFCATALLRCCSIGGVIFNRVGSERHYERLKNSVRDVAVLGYLPSDSNFEIPHRHLGLKVAEENPISDENIERLAEAVLEHINVEKIVQIANSFIEQQSSRAAEQQANNENFISTTTALLRCCSTAPKIALAYDKAFCFYYEDNLDLLKAAGAEIVRFSPLGDDKIPEGADALYIGGGYPELYAERLSRNTSMLQSIKKWADSGGPIYAECGGLMYLSNGIYDFDSNFYAMASVFPFETAMKKGKSYLGYREIILKNDCIIGKNGDRLRGHEFHYSEILKGSNKGQVTSNELKDNNNSENLPLITRHSLLPSDSLLVTCYSLLKEGKDEGYRFKNTLASYIHIHFGSNPSIAGNFINCIKEQKWKR